jgi:hypothetical protein
MALTSLVSLARISVVLISAIDGGQDDLPCQKRVGHLDLIFLNPRQLLGVGSGFRYSGDHCLVYVKGFSHNLGTVFSTPFHPSFSCLVGEARDESLEKRPLNPCPLILETVRYLTGKKTPRLSIIGRHSPTIGPVSMRE